MDEGMRRTNSQDDKQKLERDVGEDKTGADVKNWKWRKLRKQGANEGFQEENTDREEILRMWRHEADKPACGQPGHVNREQREVPEKKQNQRSQKRGQYHEVHA